MNFSRFFIDRPIFASVLSILIVVLGLVALPTIPIAQYPEVAPPTINISATYPGANASVVAETVATPIEQEINGVENMLYMSSQSANDGSYALTVTFQSGTDLNTAQVLVQNRVARAESRLPEEVRRLGVNVVKQSPDMTLVVNMISPDSSRDQLYLANYAQLQLRDTLSRQPGVGDVRIVGAREYSMRVWLDPEKAAARNLATSDIVAALREQNVQVAAGTLGQQPAPKGTALQIPLVTKGRLTDPEQFENIVVKTGEDGRVTHLRDVARVELSAYDFSTGSYLDGMPSVAMIISQLPGTNAIETADAVRAAMEELKSSFPPGVEYRIYHDTTVFVRESVSSVLHTLVEATVLVFLVVLVFLQNWRATLIPTLAVPVSIIGTIAVMAMFGFTLNNLTLFGLVLAIGIVVDDAIVVVENVERNLALGFSPKEATYRAMQEVSGPVIAIALVLCAVFVPTAFLTGITGQFYRQFALTIAVSTVISAFNSLTLSPALSAILLQGHHARKDWFGRLLDGTLGWFFRAFNWSFDKATNGYVRLVRGFIRVSVVALLIYGGLIVLTWIGFTKTPTGFIPPQDKGYLLAAATLPDAASLERTEELVNEMARIARETPGVAHTVAMPGFSPLVGGNASNAGFMVILLDPYEKRKDPELSADAIVGKLMQRYGQLGDGVSLVFGVPPVSGIGSFGGFKIVVQDRGGMGLRTLEEGSRDLIAQASQSGEIVRPFTTFRADALQKFIEVDRAKAKAMGVPLNNVFDTLQVYLGSLYVNDFSMLNRIFRVVAQAEPSLRREPEDILKLRTRNSAGEMVPLGTVVKVENTSGPDRIRRYNLYPAVEITGNPAPGISSGQALNKMEQLAENLPPGMGYEWTELSLQEKLAGNATLYIFPLCVLFVFLVLAAQYESWSMPLAIILIVPMCLLSALVGVWLRGLDNNIFVQIGFVVLIGLASKNAILIVEFAQQLRKEGKGRVEAAVEASRLRLRPILMTSFAFSLGVVPLVIATGAGAEMRVALGTAVLAGMIGVTFFGILFTPVFYVVIDWLSEKLSLRREQETVHLPHDHKPAEAGAA